jgi:AbrB family looped-hinge helix DNA binding protein
MDFWIATNILNYLPLTDYSIKVILITMSKTSKGAKTDVIRFTTKGQVVIPLRLRKQFQIEDGTKAVVQATTEGILLKPVTRWAIERGFGLLKRKAGGKPLVEEWAEHKREERGLEDK